MSGSSLPLAVSQRRMVLPAAEATFLPSGEMDSMRASGQEFPAGSNGKHRGKRAVSQLELADFLTCARIPELDRVDGLVLVEVGDPGDQGLAVRREGHADRIGTSAAKFEDEPILII